VVGPYLVLDENLNAFISAGRDDDNGGVSVLIRVVNVTTVPQKDKTIQINGRNPRIAVDASGIVNAVYSNQSTVFWAKFNTDLSNAGTPVRLSNGITGDLPDNVGGAIGPDGAMHVVCAKKSGSNMIPFYNNSSQSSSNAVSAGFSIPFSERSFCPDMVWENDTIFMVYTNATDGLPKLMRFHNNTFLPPQTLSSMAIYSYPHYTPKIGQVPGGGFYVVYQARGSQTSVILSYNVPAVRARPSHAGISIKPSITVWPNPFSTSVTIKAMGNELRAMSVSIYDINGKLVYSLPFTSYLTPYTCTPKVCQWDASNQSAGTYIIQVRGPDVNAVKRLIYRP
jgi:hypothetical protein